MKVAAAARHFKGGLRAALVLMASHFQQQPSDSLVPLDASEYEESSELPEKVHHQLVVLKVEHKSLHVPH